MNRRRFLRTLLQSAAAAAIVSSGLPLPAAASPAPLPANWRGVTWVTREFDYGNRLGTCLTIEHAVTGERRRLVATSGTPLKGHHPAARQAHDLARKQAEIDNRTWLQYELDGINARGDVAPGWPEDGVIYVR